MYCKETENLIKEAFEDTQKSETWALHSSQKINEYDQLDKFYSNYKLMSGLIEGPPGISYIKGKLNKEIRFLKYRLKIYWLYNFFKIIFLVNIYGLNKKKYLIPEKTKVGNITFYPYKNKFWNGNVIKYAYFAKLMEKKIDFSSINTFLEIGAGYGGWINQLLHCNPNAKIFVIDLAETLLLSHYFLANQFPNKKIGFLNSDNNINIDEYQIILLTPKDKKLLDGLHFDLLLNSESFLEMNRNILDDYFYWIQNKINVRYFFNFNRKSRSEGNLINTFDSMPYDKKWRHHIDRFSILRSTNLRMKIRFSERINS
tara:strand:- start:453 stop:1394 length:942 start_codon:yes stop_codon:yes gene_type:complete